MVASSVGTLIPVSVEPVFLSEKSKEADNANLIAKVVCEEIIYDQRRQKMIVGDEDITCKIRVVAKLTGKPDVELIGSLDFRASATAYLREKKFV